MMATDEISSASPSITSAKVIKITAMEKESPSSTPPTTHAETLHPQHDHRLTSVVGVPAYAEHGVAVDHHVPQEDVIQAQPDLQWSRIRHYCREPFSEFFGVFILILFGDGVVAQVVLSGGEKGDYQSISWGWG
jgi:aquaglyceroporin related protein